MAITRVGTITTATGNNASPLTPALPTGFQAGDLLVTIAGGRSGAAWGVPSGYTLHPQASWNHSSGTGPRLSAAYRFATGDANDVAPAWTYTGGSAGDTQVAVGFVLRGVDATTPWQQVSFTYSFTGVQNLGPINGENITAAGSAIIACGVKQDDWTSVATLTTEGLAWEELTELSSTDGSDAGLAVQWAVRAATGFLGSMTFTVTGGATANAVGMFLVARPGPDAPAGVTLAGTIAAVSSVAASLRVAKPLGGTVAGVSSLAAALRVAKPLAGTIAAVSSMAAALTVGDATPEAPLFTAGIVPVKAPADPTVPGTVPIALVSAAPGVVPVRFRAAFEAGVVPVRIVGAPGLGIVPARDVDA